MQGGSWSVTGEKHGIQELAKHKDDKEAPQGRMWRWTREKEEEEMEEDQEDQQPEGTPRKAILQLYNKINN